MPPRPFVAVVVIGWLAAIGWLVADRWLPWLRTSEQPAFVVDLSDEVAPDHGTWSLQVRGKKAGTAETRVAPKKDGTFEQTSRLRELELPYGPVTVKMPAFAVTQIVSREGNLLSLEAKTQMHITGIGIDSKVDVLLHGEVIDNEFRGECDLDVGGDKSVERLEPIRMTGGAFSPWQPRQKFPPLHPGQSWRVVNIDPLAVCLSAAMKQVITKKVGFRVSGDEEPPELLARVEPEIEEITHRDRAYSCRVITYQADRVLAKTWVHVEDGKVMRHEVTRNGELVVMQRE
jgi:hypothetical protein